MATVAENATNARASKTQDMKATACILCSLNCGLKVKTEGTHLTKIIGDKEICS